MSATSMMSTRIATRLMVAHARIIFRFIGLFLLSNPSVGGRKVGVDDRVADDSVGRLEDRLEKEAEAGKSQR